MPGAETQAMRRERSLITPPGEQRMWFFTTGNDVVYWMYENAKERRDGLRKTPNLSVCGAHHMEECSTRGCAGDSHRLHDGYHDHIHLRLRGFSTEDREEGGGVPNAVHGRPISENTCARFATQAMPQAWIASGAVPSRVLFNSAMHGTGSRKAFHMGHSTRLGIPTIPCIPTAFRPSVEVEPATDNPPPKTNNAITELIIAATMFPVPAPVTSNKQYSRDFRGDPRNRPVDNCENIKFPDIHTVQLVAVQHVSQLDLGSCEKQAAGLAGNPAHALAYPNSALVHGGVHRAIPSAQSVSAVDCGQRTWQLGNHHRGRNNSTESTPIAELAYLQVAACCTVDTKSTNCAPYLSR
ncbi:hypothetical protein EDD17DRAFT_1503469 [Pisolithus thermaeus]|nr:hypothetical protein EV401DRAFT_2201248 [Pisolithus croceorrhizus]KAI6168674.1 hypothetical protein EDD17DRAFT_1503469 [Pisolithus thermaeus]